MHNSISSDMDYVNGVNFLPQLDFALLFQLSCNGFAIEIMPVSLGIAKIRVKTASGKRGISLAHPYVDTRGICASKTRGQAFDKCSKECVHILCIFFGVSVPRGKWEEAEQRRKSTRKFQLS